MLSNTFDKYPPIFESSRKRLIGTDGLLIGVRRSDSDLEKINQENETIQRQYVNRRLGACIRTPRDFELLSRVPKFDAWDFSNVYTDKVSTLKLNLLRAMDYYGLMHLGWRGKVEPLKGNTLGMASSFSAFIIIDSDHTDKGIDEYKDTILHEIAHALNYYSEKSHGPKWKKICKILGCVPLSNMVIPYEIKCQTCGYKCGYSETKPKDTKIEWAHFCAPNGVPQFVYRDRKQNTRTWIDVKTQKKVIQTRAAKKRK